MQGATLRQTREVAGKTVGQRIREARLAKGMTLAQVGGTELSRSFISSVETGRSRISLRALAVVAENLGLPMSYFLEDENAKEERLAAWFLAQAEAEIGQGQYDDALTLLRQLPADFSEGHVAWLTGRALFHLSRIPEAVTILQDNLPIVVQGADQHFVAEYQCTLGAMLYSTGELSEALRTLHAATDTLARLPEDPLLLGRVTVNLGHVYYVQGQPELAIRHYERALALFGKIRDYYMQACIYSGLGLTAREQGNLAAALRYARLSVGAFSATNNLRQAAAEVNNMAGRYLEMNHLEEAVFTGQDAVNRARDLHATDLEAMAHTTLAQTYLQADQLEEAAAELAAAEPLVGPEDRLARAAVLKNRAQIAERTGHDENAAALYQQVLTILRDAPGQRLYIAAALAYGKLLRRQGDVEGALDLALSLVDDRLTQQL